jgi:arginyl-tRNA synthetase
MDVTGVEIPKVTKTEKVLEKRAQDRQKTAYVYIDGSAQKTIQLVLSEALELNPEDIQVSQTQDNKYGDYTSPVAMRLSKERRQNPIVIAKEIALKIRNNEIFNKCEAVAPGYINFFLSDSYLKKLLLSIDENFGVSKEMAGKKIMVEYGQPNTHKAVTVGHVKSAISGMSVARLYENLGYDVVHANYFGDLGPYVAKSIFSLLNKVGKVESVSDITEEIVDSAIELIEGIKKDGGYSALKEYFGNLYVEASKVYESDEEVTGVVKEINALLFNKQNELINKIYKYTRTICIEYLNDFFGSLGVKYDRQYPESEAWEKGKEIVVENIGKVFKEDQGAIIFDGKEFKLSNWVFLTSQGTPTYSGKELGLIDLKFKEYPDLDFALVLTSVEQNEYFKGVIKAWELINPQLVGKYRHIGFGWLLMNNKKTSSRGGTVSFDEMIAEAKDLAKEKISELKEYSESEIESISNSIATSGFKFNILSHEFHKDINYDPKSFLSLSGYSAPYIIYSYTRAMSILAKVGEIKNIDLTNVLKSSEELDLMRRLNEYPEIVRNSGLNLSPHLLCEYLYKLANTFNAFYTTNRIVDEPDDIKYSRSILISKTAQVLKKGLYLLGIDVIEKM